MADLQALDVETARLVATVCDAIVPGSARVRPAGAPDRGLLQRFRRTGVDAEGAWSEIDFNTPLATRLAKDWSYLGIR